MERVSLFLIGEPADQGWFVLLNANIFVSSCDWKDGIPLHAGAGHSANSNSSSRVTSFLGEGVA